MAEKRNYTAVVTTKYGTFTFSDANGSLVYEQLRNKRPIKAIDGNGDTISVPFWSVDHAEITITNETVDMTDNSCVESSPDDVLFYVPTSDGKQVPITTDMLECNQSEGRYAVLASASGQLHTSGEYDASVSGASTSATIDPDGARLVFNPLNAMVVLLNNGDTFEVAIVSMEAVATCEEAMALAQSFRGMTITYSGEAPK